MQNTGASNTDKKVVLPLLQARLAEGAQTYGVPGAQMAVLSGGVFQEAVYGVTDIVSGTAATYETRFKVGSITKLMTAVLSLKLVDQAVMNLDTPIASYISGFHLKDQAAAQAVTMRQLLSHCSGFDGDFFIDVGDGDDCLARYVERCAVLDQLFPPGAMHSYNNAAFPILAHASEQLTDSLWDRLMQTHIFDPCAMTQTTTGVPGGAGVFIACGHIPGKGDTLVPVADKEPRALAPCGARPYGTATDLLRLGAMLLNDGIGSGGTRVLSAFAVRQMLREHVAGPCATFADGWGLGVMLFDWTNGKRLFGHDGAVPGQSSYLRVEPQSGVICALMANGGDMRGLAQDIFAHVFGTLAGTEPAQIPLPAQDNMSAKDLSLFEGRYGTRAATIEVLLESDGLVAIARPTAEGTGGAQQLITPLCHVEGGLFAAKMPGQSCAMLQRFVGIDKETRPRYFNFRGRAYPRLPGNADGGAVS